MTSVENQVPTTAGWRPHPRYLDPAITALDPCFDRYWLKQAAVERLSTGCRWAEGPVWCGDGRYLLWSAMPNNRVLTWEEATGTVSVLQHPPNCANGHTRDRHGRLITCEHGGRRVTRTAYDGTLTVVMDTWQGHRLNSPDDVVVTSDSSIWFTDPMFGILVHDEGSPATPEVEQHVDRLDGETGAASIVADDIPGPNGRCCAPDESRLSVVASRAESHHQIVASEVTANGRELRNTQVLIDAGPGGTPDGLRYDIDGNLWCGWGMGTAALDGVVVCAPDGTLLGRIA